MLLRLPGLIDLLKSQRTSFFQEVVSWIESLEHILVNNRMQAAGNVASLRAAMITGEQGVIPASLIFHGQPTKRKMRDAIAADVIRSACDLVSNAIKEDELRFSEAQSLCRQVVVLAKSKSKIPVETEELDRLQYLKAVWQILSSDPDIVSGTVRLEGLVGSYDVLVMLDRMITAELT